MKIIKEKDRKKFSNDKGILCRKIEDSTTVKVTKFYSRAPFPNYQGYENKFVLSQLVSENVFLNDLKKL